MCEKKKITVQRNEKTAKEREKIFETHLLKINNIQNMYRILTMP